MWLLGDSSLDNKYWLPSPGTRTPAVNGFEAVLSPPTMRRDVAYWTNKHLADATAGVAPFCLNAAVEESTIGHRILGLDLTSTISFAFMWVNGGPGKVG